MAHHRTSLLPVDWHEQLQLERVTESALTTRAQTVKQSEPPALSSSQARDLLRFVQDINWEELDEDVEILQELGVQIGRAHV